jgi:hypothetical protein
MYVKTKGSDSRRPQFFVLTTDKGHLTTEREREKERKRGNTPLELDQ